LGDWVRVDRSSARPCCCFRARVGPVMTTFRLARAMEMDNDARASFTVREATGGGLDPSASALVTPLLRARVRHVRHLLARRETRDIYSLAVPEGDENRQAVIEAAGHIIGRTCPVRR
jgi:hypothetical protein